MTDINEVIATVDTLNAALGDHFKVNAEKLTAIQLVLQKLVDGGNGASSGQLALINDHVKAVIDNANAGFASLETLEQTLADTPTGQPATTPVEPPTT